MKTGIMIGKFMPLHIGHSYCIEYGVYNFDKMTVYIDDFDESPYDLYISLDDRYTIIKKEFPSANIVKAENKNPQSPDEDINFWQIWRDIIIKANGGIPDCIIGSEKYIIKLAEVVECDYKMIDIKRDKFDISATMVRNNWIDNWSMLPESTKKFFQKKIAIIGPESTGKTTITNKISKLYNVTPVEEFAMSYLQSFEGELKEEDFRNIYIGQKENIIDKANEKIIISDTDAITTNIWSKKILGSYDENLFKKYNFDFDLYILMNLNEYDFKNIKGRFFDDLEIQKWFFNEFINELKKRNKKYIIVEGNTWEEKESFIKNVINKELLF